MHHYQFVLADGSEPDSLGGMTLRDDGAALAFGKRVIGDLERGDQCASGIIVIAEGERIVGAIAFPTGDQNG